MASGCGDTSGAALTKVELLKEGDAICEAADKQQNAAFHAYLKKNPKAQTAQGAELAMVVAAIGLPPIQKEAEELKELGAPSGDGDQIDAIVDGIEKAVEKGEETPALLLQKSEGPFTEVGKLADSYGFAACSKPL